VRIKNVLLSGQTKLETNFRRISTIRAEKGPKSSRLMFPVLVYYEELQAFNPNDAGKDQKKPRNLEWLNTKK
jgi:hypothetical protein